MFGNNSSYFGKSRATLRGQTTPAQKDSKSWDLGIFSESRNAVWGYKISPNRFKTTYRSVLTSEEKKQSITHLFTTFSGLGLGCNAFILQKSQKIRSTERFKTSAILNARFRKSYFKLKVNSRAVTSQTSNQTGRRVCVSVHRATDLNKFPWWWWVDA